MGDVNASIPTTELVYYRAHVRSHGRSKEFNFGNISSKMALRRGLKNRVRIGRKLVPVRNCRRIGKHDMVLKNNLPKTEVDPESFIVRINGEIAETKPSRTLELSRLYNLL